MENNRQRPLPLDEPRKMTKITNLIVDAGAIIKGIQLQEIGEKFYTTPHVMAEVRDRQVRQQVAALPFEIHEKIPSQEAMRAGTSLP